MSTTPVSYWGGLSVKTGSVKKLNASTFAELVTRFVNVPVSFPFTHQEFWAMTEDERNSVKDGPFICPCSFSFESEGRRADENATQSVLAILDADEGEWIKDIAENPETLVDALYPYNFVCWHTIKSRPEAPRLKIMVDLSPCHPSNHRRIIQFIASRIGAPRDFKGCRESSVISQAQYRPAMMKGSNFTAVIASNTTGIPLHISDVPELDDEEAELVEGRTYACDPAESDEFFGLAYLPVQDLAVEDIREALFTIDADCGYKTWTEVAASLRHQFTTEEQAQEAYEMFVEWSSQGTKFKGRRDCYTKWKSFRPFVKGRAPVTVRSLFHYAQASGWDNHKVAKKLAQSTEDWIAQCTDAADLMQEGITRIAAMVFPNGVVEEALVNAWRARIKAVSGETIDKTTLKREIGKVRKADKKAKAEAKGDNTPGWLRPIVYISTSDVFHNLGNGVDLKPGAFDRTYAALMMPKDETPANGLPVMQPGAYALNILKVLRVDEALYDPTRKEDERIYPCKDTGKVILNTYNHQALPVPDPEHKDRAEKLFYQAVTPLIREPELRELLIDYCALQTQFPGRKIPWSFMIQSGPGAGKGTLSEIMQAVMGPANVAIISPAMMKADFNEWAVGTAFGVFNEVHIPGDRRDQVMNAIKPLITDPTISISLKHRDGKCQVRNFTNYIAFTNDKNAAYLSAEDRRWGIAFSPIQTKEQSEALAATGHFDEVRWLITPEGASALRYFFLKRKISPDFPLTGHAPNTKYRDEVIAQSKNHLQIAIEDMIEDGEDPLIGPEVIHEGRLRERLHCQPREAALMTRYLSLIGYERESAKRVMIDGCQRGHVWVHTEKWKGKDAAAYLKKRLKEVPSLDAQDEEFEFS